MKIDVDHITMIYPSGKKALQDISLHAESPNFIGVLGPNGAGKTTLMNLLGALDTPDSGRIIIGRQVISNMSQHQRTLYRRNSLGFIYQDFNLIQVLNVYENIMLPLMLKRRPLMLKRRPAGNGKLGTGIWDGRNRAYRKCQRGRTERG